MNSQESPSPPPLGNPSAARRFDAAIEAAWAAYRLDPGDLNSKMSLAGLLHRQPESIDADKKSDVIRLIQDRDIDPEFRHDGGMDLDPP